MLLRLFIIEMRRARREDARRRAGAARVVMMFRDHYTIEARQYC